MSPSTAARWAPRAHAITAWLAAALIWCAAPAQAGQSASHPAFGSGATEEAQEAPALPTAVPLVPDAPPVPIAPQTISRDAEGHATLRAVRVTQPIRIDGVLNEESYTTVPSMSDFIQVEPDHGAPATERTEVWVLFDDKYLYLSGRMWDEHPETILATEKRRDSQAMSQGNDTITFIIDGFYDRRNGVVFTVNPIGGRTDSQVTAERQFNNDWNPVWLMKTGRFEHGWSAEIAIPFQSLRYRPGRDQVWGFNAQRTKRSKNELSLLTKVAQGRNQGAMAQASQAATLVGIQTPVRGRNWDVKPYATSSLTTNRLSTPQLSNDPNTQFGLDLKAGVTQGLSADLTINTDFAQVEADEQQVNLTRFSQFFPEKREFFLENQGTFAFGGVQIGGNQAGNPNNLAPIMFYSRRIGLNAGRVVPLELGGRLTGRAGPYSVGILNTNTGEEDALLPGAKPKTNFSVVRLRRDILRRSSVGVIATGRTVSAIGAGSNLTYGLDGTFAFFANLNINASWATSDTTSLRGRGDDASYRGEFNLNGDRYGVVMERISVGDNFNPEIGFVRRDNMVRDYAQFRFSPRPRNRFKSVRRFRYQGTLSYIENRKGSLESREREGEFGIEFQNGDQLQLNYLSQLERLPVPFPIAGGITLPVGRYPFNVGTVGFNLGRQRRLSGNMSFEFGSFYNGTRQAFTMSQGRFIVTNALAVEPSYTLNNVDLKQGSFLSHLLGSRITYTVSPWMFVSALVQYNSATSNVSTNARLRWEYQPGSELFVVFNDDRNTLTRGFPGLNSRAFIVKVNRLFRR